MNQLRYSLFILAGACSYGFQASIVKLATNAGYPAGQMTGSQYIFGLLLMIIPFMITKRIKLQVKQIVPLLGLGVLLSLTGVFYATSIQELSASIAIVLLFQFTWMGILIESVYLKAFPSVTKIISAVLLWAGTLLAAGISSEGINWADHSKGFISGFLAALTFALFIFFSGKTGKEVPAIQKSFVISIGGLVTACLFVSPAFVIDGTMTGGLWKYGLLVGLLGVLVPVVLFALGTPYVDSGMATILGAAELPAAMIGAMFIVGEHLTGEQGAGIVLILIGIAVPQLRRNGRVRPKQLSSS
ncbi:DMT family transporter [Pseudobacillus sp. FSL P4-0506]|uniref:DMT family transporter n=1 Tax=unclassified Pseudobacillus TaxID=2619284 RepID=UPI0030F7E090